MNVAVPARGTEGTGAARLQRWLVRYGVLVGGLALAIFFSTQRSAFYAPRNLIIILRSASIVTIVGCGAVFVFLVRGIDLSVGSTASVCGLICIGLMRDGLPVPAAILCSLVLGAVIGLFNSGLIVGLRINPLIATLATMFILNSSELIYTGGWPIYGVEAPGYYRLGQGSIAGIPICVYLMALVVALAYVLTEKSRTGRYWAAIGTNIWAAQYSGVRVRRYATLAYVGCSTLCAFGGIVLVSYLGQGYPAVGSGLLLTGLTAVLVSQTLIKVGQVNVLGTIVGAVLISMLENGLTLMNVSLSYQNLLKGLIIILAIALSSVVRQRS